MNRTWLCGFAWLGLATLTFANTSNSLLDVSRDGKQLLAANNDNGTVTVIDVAQRQKLREISVGKKPEGVSWIGAGPQALITLYEESAVVLIDANTGQVLKRIPTQVEPYGVVVDRAGQRAWVSHEYPGVISEIDLGAGKVTREIPAGAFLRGLALSPNEQRLYVTEFYTGILHAVDLASGKVVDSWKGQSRDNLARHVFIHPKRPKAYIPHIRSMIKINDGAGSIFPKLSICDLRPDREDRRHALAMDTFNALYVPTNPYEAAMTPDGKRFFLIYAATDDVTVCNVIDDDYKEIVADGYPRPVGKNPRAVRVSPDGKTLFVLNAMDFAVGFYNAQTLQPQAKVICCAPPKTPEWVRGKILFNSSRPPMSRPRWVACSSCHPDGHHDARVWQQPEGLRKTTAFFGMAHTHPIHWSADRDEVQDFEYTIRSNLMQGQGLLSGAMKRKVGFHKVELEEKTSGRSKDLDAMAIYCNSFEPLLSPHLEAPGKLTASAQRGKELFFSKAVGCATCHSGPYYSDSSLQTPYKLHDVGTGADDPTEKMGPYYDTPTLVGIYRAAPYLHHGKAKTLLEVLTTYNPRDKHGKTSHLNPGERDDLVSFLKSLPYEPLPATTPNTVTFRVPPEMKNGQ